MISLPFIIAGNAGNYKGILISANLYNNHHNGNGLSGSLVKRKKIFITNDNNLRQAVEIMAKENIESLPVISGENNHVVGELSSGIFLQITSIKHTNMKRNNLIFL